MRIAAAALMALTLAGPAFAAITPQPKTAQPQPYVPPDTIEEEHSCLDIMIRRREPDAEIFLRNSCAIRVNFALCVRRFDETQAAIRLGSLSPAAVHQEVIHLTPETKTFTHTENFCLGLTCEVTPPTC